MGGGLGYSGKSSGACLGGEGTGLECSSVGLLIGLGGVSIKIILGGFWVFPFQRLLAYPASFFFSRYLPMDVAYVV